MTFEQDLNDWCKDTEREIAGLHEEIGKIKLTMASIGSKQNLHVSLTLANLAIMGGLLAAVITGVIH